MYVARGVALDSSYSRSFRKTRQDNSAGSAAAGLTTFRLFPSLSFLITLYQC